MAEIQKGFLLIADITGYTMYLSRSELEHAQQVLQSLLELLVENTRPPLRISRLEGDAVFSYTLPQHSIESQTFIEIIESTYVAFRRAIEQLVMNNTCKCNACANISSLDLKFCSHYGEFGIQHLAKQDELVGSDINLIHRLSKNHIVEKTGIRAYAAYTDDAIRAMNLEELTGKMVHHQEEYEHLGTVELWIQDMKPVWLERRDSLRISIPPELTLAEVASGVAMPPEMVWNYLVQPEFRKTLFGADRFQIVDKKEGRVGVGSSFQCYHGDRFTPETIIQWFPFEEMMTEDIIPIPFNRITILLDVQLSPTAQGTRIVQICSKARGPKPGAFIANIILGRQVNKFQSDLEAFVTRIEEDYLQHEGSLLEQA